MYYRITAYNENEDLSIIVDSNGKFEKLWEFSVFLKEKGFTIIQASKDENMLDYNIEKAEYEANQVLLRAVSKGKPTNTVITIKGTKYNAIQVKSKIYVPNYFDEV